jgi:hypothetical protein
MQFFTDRPILKYGIASALVYWTIALALTFVIERSLLALSFYVPGTVFGICLFIGFDKAKITNRLFPLSIILLTTAFYLLIIFFCSRNISYSIQARHFLSCGLGAILLFFSISLSYKVDFSVTDYLLAFIVGLATTFFMWTDKFDSFNPWLMLFCIGLWQVTISILLVWRLGKVSQ